MNPNQSELSQAIQLIRNEISNAQSRIEIVCETGEDESIALGTKDGFLRLALLALEFVEQSRLAQGQSELVGPCTVTSTALFGGVFRGIDFNITSGWITNSEADAMALIEYIQRVSPRSHG